MGVPKFYRWISERYPNISRVINNNQIPDFDNFYLDMNGIIHVCSHVNDDNCETNITEEEIFRNIFHYIDFLFRMIKPKKVFFLAVDGVAPRAKMNQQRSRRFRAGRDRVKKLKTLAEKTGQTLKDTMAQHFDTNAITPGTKFMENLDEQLKYFINVKLTTDPLWDGVDIHLSGHLTPGEGEHKIMEYIRYTRSLPGYDVNTRHCLYGLDADLIMLGLVTHEMHFALLREEVKYGPKKISKILAPEEVNWHLLQLCLLRDYIDLEFRSIREKLKFPYDLESIVDDWILMGYLVGNDFIPHLPHVHINQDALTMLWETYKAVLPTLGGYMNETGDLNLPRFQIYLKELSKYDYERFKKENDETKEFYKPKSAPSQLDKDQVSNIGFSAEIMEKLMITPPINLKRESNNNSMLNDSNGRTIDNFIASERRSANELILDDDDDNQLRVYPDVDDDDRSSNSGQMSDNESDQKKRFEYNRSLSTLENEFRQHKNNYYRDKMKSGILSAEQLRTYVQQYIEALQWILKYYYQGCPSWSWFYPHHYAPYLSDLTNFKDLQFTFHQGTPFKPFEQLLAVLPPTSRYLLPTALQPLMVDVESPLLQFYPEDFLLDQNEKKQDWEAIVLLPFIDEQLLLSSINKYYLKVDPTEQIRNKHLPSLCFKSSSVVYPMNNTLANNNPYFPPLKQTRAVCYEYSIDLFRANGLKFKHGRFDEANMIHFPKFPILNVLPYTYEFKKGVVDIFESRSKSTTVVLNLTYQPDADCITYYDTVDLKDNENSQPFQILNRQLLIERYLGKRIFVNWPHFEYGIVAAISDFRYMYTWSNIPGGSYFNFRSMGNEDNQDHKHFVQTPIYVSRCPFEVNDDSTKSITSKAYSLDPIQIQAEYTKAINIKRRYEHQQGILIGATPLLLYVCPLIGYRTKCLPNSDKCQTTMCFSNQAIAYPLQTATFNIRNYKYDLFRFPHTVHDYVKINDPVFTLQAPYYSCMGYVEKITNDNGKCMIECRMDPSDIINQPDIHSYANKLSRLQVNYWTAQQVAEYLQTMPYVISKLTGTIIVTSGSGQRENMNRINVGLSWRSNRPVKQLYGYTKKEERVWLYSDAAVLVISDYMLQFPEIINELIKKPKEETYAEMNIWPTRKGKSRLQEIRMWIKSLPTYSMPLMDGAWQVLDAPVIKEIDRITKSFYAKHPSKNSNEKTKLISLEASRIFKPNESWGMCDSDIETCFNLYDRVITVRLGTGVPLGTRGTVIGVLLGQTHLDTYYEILFDNLPKNSLDSILQAKHNQQCRIKVRSYHLLNYSHSLRMRSTTNVQSQRSVPMENVWEKRLCEQSSTTSRQVQQQQQQQQPQPTRILKRNPNDNSSDSVGPKTALTSISAQEKPSKFTEAAACVIAKEQQSASTASVGSTSLANVLQSQSTATTLPSLMPSPKTNEKKSSVPENSSLSNNIAVPITNETSSIPANSTPGFLLMRAIQESIQIQNHAEQKPWNRPSQTTSISLPHQSLGVVSGSVQQPTQPGPTPSVLAQKSTDLLPTIQPAFNALFAQAIESMSCMQSSSLPPSQSSSAQNRSEPQHPQQQASLSMLERAIQQSDEQLSLGRTSQIPTDLDSTTSFQPFSLISPDAYAGFPIGPTLVESPSQPQQKSPVQSNNTSAKPSQTISSPLVAHNSSPSMTTTTQQTNSPSTTIRPTLQFIPSQVLRKMSRTHK